MALVKTGEIISADDHLLHDEPELSHHVICKSPDKLLRLINSLKPGRLSHYVSDGDWSMHDLVTELLKKYQPAELYITTYAIREFPIRQLILAQDRKEITAINLLMDYRAKVRTPEVFHMANFNANRIGLTSIHAKVTVIKSPKGSVTIISSSNWTQNPRIEAGVITLDESSAQFHIDWITKKLDNGEIFD